MDQREYRLQTWYARYLDSINVLFCASPGGMRTNIGTAVKMKNSGYKKGFPDIAIFEPRGPFHGLFVELKCGTKPSRHQLGWRSALQWRSYKCIIVPSELDYRQAQDWLEKETSEYLALIKVIGPGYGEGK